MLKDLRDFVEQVEARGELKIVKGAHWDLEIGHITEAVAATINPPTLLFDSIQEYPQGYRVLTLPFGTLRRFALALGFPDMSEARDIVMHWREKMVQGKNYINAVEVEAAPIKENVLLGDEIDLFRFPVPKWHTLDGGRYIGTGDMVITRDPDEGWVNFGTYRVQIHNEDKTKAMIWISPGHHGRLMREKYWSKGVPAPVAVVCGQDPLLFLAATAPEVWGTSEYGYAGWLKNAPIEVTKGVVTDLPIPARAEIVLEGEILPPEIESAEEGPFGEWTGYYASGAAREAVFQVRAVLHRNSPIILGVPPIMTWRSGWGGSVRKSAMLWDELNRIVPGVVGVWALEDARGINIPVISLKQMYPGHAKQVATVAAGSRAAAYHEGRFIIVVDDDIDAFNQSEVLWALGTRCDPQTQIDILRDCWSTPLDPTIGPEKRKEGNYTNSKALVLACKPYHWKDKFPRDFKLTRDEVTAIRKKWGWLFRD